MILKFVSIYETNSIHGIKIKSPIFIYRLKLECEKLANEKTEMQRHYVMVSKVLIPLFDYLSVLPFNIMIPVHISI